MFLPAAQQVLDPQPLEAHGLLEGIAQAQVGSLGDGHVGNINTVQQDLTAGGLIDARDDLGQRGFAAAVGAGDGYKTLLYGKTHIVQDLFIVVGFIPDVTQF